MRLMCARCLTIPFTIRARRSIVDWSSMAEVTISEVWQDSIYRWFGSSEPGSAIPDGSVSSMDRCFSFLLLTPGDPIQCGSSHFGYETASRKNSDSAFHQLRMSDFINIIDV